MRVVEMDTDCSEFPEMKRLKQHLADRVYSEGIGDYTYVYGVGLQINFQPKVLCVVYDGRPSIHKKSINLPYFLIGYERVRESRLPGGVKDWLVLVRKNLENL